MGNPLFEKGEQKRPYWHVDAKWLSGIIFLVFFISGILFLNISQIISKNNVVDKASGNIESAIREEAAKFFDNNGKPIAQNKEIILKTLTISNDKLKEIDSNFKEKAESASSAIASSYIKILESPKDFSKNIATIFAYQLENNLSTRASGALEKAKEKIQAADLKDARAKDEIISKISIPKIYSEQQYLRYRNNAIFFLFISLLLLIAAIYFSSGFGRISTLGFLIFMSSLPGFFVTLSFVNYLRTSLLNNYLNSDNKIISIFSTSILDAFKSQANSLFAVYKYLFISALALFTIGIIGMILSKIFQTKSTADISPRLK